MCYRGVDTYFKVFFNTLETYDLKDKVTASKLRLCNEPDKVVATQRTKNLHILTRKVKPLSLLFCFNAKDNLLQSDAIFCSKTRKKDWKTCFQDQLF